MRVVVETPQGGAREKVEHEWPLVHRASLRAEPTKHTPSPLQPLRWSQRHTRV